MTDQESQTKLRNHYGPAIPIAAAKVIRVIDRHCREFISNAPFCVLATTDGETLDVSPKGGTPGFAKVETEQTLLLPDYPGNNRIDGMMNIAANPQVATVFFIPGVQETLRVNGTCEIVLDPYEVDRLGLSDKKAKAALRISVQEAFMHCGAALSFAQLWQPESWPKERPIGSIREVVDDHAKLD